MANHKTGAQRYNDRMSKIFEEARKNTDNWGSGFAYASKESKKMLLKNKKQEMAKKMKVKSEGKPYKFAKNDMYTMGRKDKGVEVWVKRQNKDGTDIKD